MIMIYKNLKFTVETTALLILYFVNQKKNKKKKTGALKSAAWCSINTDHTDSYVEARKGQT